MPCWLVGAVGGGRAGRCLDVPVGGPLWIWPRVRVRIGALAERRPRRLIVLGGGCAAVAGLVVGGPVAAAVLATYAALAVRALVRQAARRRAARRGREASTTLRPGRGSAGGPATRCGDVWSPVDGGSDHAVRSVGTDPRIAELTAAVWRLAERTGAPAADLVERIEADARAADRATASAAAQAAGAQATALLLAGAAARRHRARLRDRGGPAAGAAAHRDWARRVRSAPCCCSAAVCCGRTVW